MSIFRVAALPAREGDCLVLSWGPSEGELRHMVVDAGHSETSPILLEYLRSVGAKRLDLVVVTHVDADHIEGMLDFLPAARTEFEIGEVWFNGYRHLKDNLEGFGPVQGELLTKMLTNLPWNSAANGGAIRTFDNGSPRVFEMPGNLRLTVISPDANKLKSMITTWEKSVREAGLEPGQDRAEPETAPGLEVLGGDIDALAATRTGKDLAKANGSSIAFVAEYAGKSVLMAADAHPGLLERGLESMSVKQKLPIHLFKVPHHGSQNNLTRELLGRIDCQCFLISTDGTKFGHPDPVAIARIIAASAEGVELLFNYSQPRTREWADRPEAGKRYRCTFPQDGEALIIDV